MSESDSTGNADRYAIEQAIARLDADREGVNAFMVHVKWIVTVVSSIVIVMVGFASFLGVSSLNDVSSKIVGDAKSQVRQAIQEDAKNVNALKQLNSDLEQAKTDYEANREAIDALTAIQGLVNIDKQDPYFAYERLSLLEGEESTAENRGAALKLLAIIIDAGERASADPNMLFNAAVSASRLNFLIESVKLSVLAEYWRPSTAHKANKAQTSEVLGKTFQFVNNTLEQLEATPTEVRQRAWNDILDMIRASPRLESEQIYSRASNVAVRNRANGYYSQLGEAILESEKLDHNQLTSYAYLTLANTFAWTGNSGWADQYWGAVGKALDKLKNESPEASWYGNTVSEILVGAANLGLGDEFLALSESKGLPFEFWVERVPELFGG